MTHIVRLLSFPHEINETNYDTLMEKEWILTNALGGYASATVLGATSRKYHGLLVAALPPPLGRIVILNYVQESILLPNGKIEVLSHEERLDNFQTVQHPLIEFRLENGLPIWTFALDGFRLEKRLFLDHEKNTVHFMYKIIEGDGPLKLIFEPFYNFRHHEEPVHHCIACDFEYETKEGFYQINIPTLPSLNIITEGECQLITQNKFLENIRYRVEDERGYDFVGPQSSAGHFFATLSKENDVAFTFSCERIEDILHENSLDCFTKEKERRERLISKAKEHNPHVDFSFFALELVLAADQFIIKSPPRIALMENERAVTIIAGYHWFTDWGRDTMISLEGLTLVTGRIVDARYILRTFAQMLNEGLIPNMIPDKASEGRYNTVDATLWFFHALERYLHYSKDEGLIISLLPILKEIIDYHVRGTKFHIKVDKSDGLLNQGEEGFALTWMDAKVDDLVVTPRRGKAVEINALWYNALRILIEWIEIFEEKEMAIPYQKLADQCLISFNQKFWLPNEKYLKDIVEGEEGDDLAFRPNQLFSISLKYPVLQKDHWQDVLEQVKEKLLTPVGLRTLAPGHNNYKVMYKGNLFVRDSAYHQGTIWPWLMGPFIDAWIKAFPNKKEEVKQFLDGFQMHLSEGAIGTISEIFDAEKPYNHRGCVAQAWSVAEILRVWIKTKRDQDDIL